MDEYGCVIEVMVHFETVSMATAVRNRTRIWLNLVEIVFFEVDSGSFLQTRGATRLANVAIFITVYAGMREDIYLRHCQSATPPSNFIESPEKVLVHAIANDCRIRRDIRIIS